VIHSIRQKIPTCSRLIRAKSIKVAEQLQGFPLTSGRRQPRLKSESAVRLDSFYMPRRPSHSSYCPNHPSYCPNPRFSTGYAAMYKRRRTFVSLRRTYRVRHIETMNHSRSRHVNPEQPVIDRIKSLDRSFTNDSGGSNGTNETQSSFNVGSMIIMYDYVERKLSRQPRARLDGKKN